MQKKKNPEKKNKLPAKTDALSYPICLEVDTNTVTMWRSQREEPNLTGRGLCMCGLFLIFLIRGGFVPS